MTLELALSIKYILKYTIIIIIILTIIIFLMQRNSETT